MARKPVEKKQISQEWLTTYSDMVTLVLTFFVLLYSYSLVDIKKFKAVAAALQNALFGESKQTIFQYTDTSGNVPIIGEEQSPQNEDITENEKSEEAELYEKVTSFIDENLLNDAVTIKEDKRGVIIEFKDKILFDTGKAVIREDSKPILDKIGELINKFPNPIIVEGHTDNVPVKTAPFPSNWELSSARSLAVLRYLTEERSVSPKRVSSVAYGEYSPIADNSTPEGKAQNRRVNILIVSTKNAEDKK